MSDFEDDSGSKSTSRWKKGDTFGRTGYMVLAIKEGGMGIVYIIADSHNPTMIYAAKTFKDKYMKEEKIIKRFWFEAQKWVELERHENIVYADHIFEVEGKPYLYLEFVKGNNLKYWIMHQRLDLAQSVEFALQFCTGMEFVRQTKGLIHRDIKPENCLITEQKILKITDWGLAKAFEGLQNLSMLRQDISLSPHSASIHLTQVGAVMGTPPYMSPEQCRGESDLDIRSDIYSFGCMFYEMMGKRLPFRCENSIEFMAHHLEEKPMAISGIAREYNAILLKCLEKRPNDRFATFADLGNAISEANQPQTKNKISKPIAERIKQGVSPIGWEELTSKGFGLLHLRREKEAIEYFDKAIALNPNNYTALGYKGYCLGNLGRHDEAIASCERAVKINPNFAHAWGNLGFSYSKLKKFERAIECYSKAIKLDPRDVTHYNNQVIAYQEWGDSEKDFRKFEEGIKITDLGLKIDPRFFRLWINKGNCLRSLKKQKEAIPCYKAAIDINPRAKAALGGISLCYLELGDKENMQKYYTLAMQIDDDYIT